MDRPYAAFVEVKLNCKLTTNEQYQTNYKIKQLGKRRALGKIKKTRNLLGNIQIMQTIICYVL